MKATSDAVGVKPGESDFLIWHAFCYCLFPKGTSQFLIKFVLAIS